MLVALQAVAATTDTPPGPTTPPVMDLEQFRDCADCPEMVVLPAGSFVMGRADGYRNERPAHRVTIARSFAIAVREATVAEWEACVDAGVCDPSFLRVSAGGSSTPAYPICGPSWEDARQYSAWLSAKTGQSYRLPSEAEWEYAARGGTQTRYWWGDKFVRGLANCWHCDGKVGQETVAGTFPPNAYGLFDVAGNLMEWTDDCWNPSYDGAPTDGSAWLEGDCSLRLLRGGSRSMGASQVTVTFRRPFPADAAACLDWGFRVVRDM